MRPFGLVLITSILLSCHVREGESCICAGDCKSGLVCALDGDVLGGGECTPTGAADPGTCVPADDSLDQTTGLVPPPPLMDAGSKLDLPGATSAGTTAATTTATTAGSDTGTSTSTSGGS